MDTGTLTPPARRVLRLLETRQSPVYLVHAARGRYVLVSPEYPDSPRHVDLDRISVDTLVSLTAAGRVETGQAGVNVGHFRGWRHLDRREGRLLRLRPSS